MIHIYSNGNGLKRGILVSGTNRVSIRDSNIYVYEPTSNDSHGSYVGVETDDSSNIGTIEIRNSTIGVVLPIDASYNASDIFTNQTGEYTRSNLFD